ncbi:MAG: aspartate/glutamate racemase family protein [Deltaproteobacteria bacterium]|jgi:aspartate racemase|nr:aspartate/glutamate racemase family protein [Deltaproteobacteria bacterium]MBT4527576.1 aspartate/glutamate racemase family protein [Deltaproteobacteria bacterium]
MKTIGLLGGMSWESTLSYYKEINEAVRRELGSLHSAKIAMFSVDFQEIETLQHQGKWEETGVILGEASKSIQVGGADFLVICTNTMHKVAPQIETAIDIPILHIADATAEQMVEDGIKAVGLLGTAFTMEQDFYKKRVEDKYKIEVLVPNQPDRAIVHDIIYQELCLGKVEGDSREQYLRIIEDLSSSGAEAVILGCTEIALLVNSTQTSVKLYDTTQIHAQKAVEWALS